MVPVDSEMIIKGECTDTDSVKSCSTATAASEDLKLNEKLESAASTECDVSQEGGSNVPATVAETHDKLEDISPVAEKASYNLVYC